MSFQIHGWNAYPEKVDLEEARSSATAEDGEPLHVYYLNLFDGGLCPPWKLFGFCTLTGLVNIFSMFFTLAATTDLSSSDIILESNIILLSTALLITLVWRLNSPHYQSAKEYYHPDDEALSCFRLRTAGSLFAILLSPAVACFSLLVIFWFLGSESLSYNKPGIPLFISWAAVNALATLLVPSFVRRQDMPKQGEFPGKAAPLPQGAEDCGGYDYFDETDGPTFLPQQPISAYYNNLGEFITPEMKTVSTFTPGISWEDTIESPEAIREVIRWAIIAPEESLQPSVAELLVKAAASIGVYLDGTECWNQNVQYTYLVSQTCDRLAEIFQQVDPAAIPVHVVDVFLFVDRLEQFDEIDVTFLDSDNCYIPVEELDRVVRCLKAKSAALLGC